VALSFFSFGFEFIFGVSKKPIHNHGKGTSGTYQTHSFTFYPILILIIITIIIFIIF
jgi:hypothetical protein